MSSNILGAVLCDAESEVKRKKEQCHRQNQNQPNKQKKAKLEREGKETEALDTAQNKTYTAPGGQIHSRRGMEFQES